MVKEHIRSILEIIGGDLQKTPDRSAKALMEFLDGYNQEANFDPIMFDCDMNQTIIVKNIDFMSLCEHHLLPIVGRVHIGYIPDGKVIGLSKIARIVDIFSKRLQIQERMTMVIAQYLHKKANAQGVAIFAEAEHFCMNHRGVNKHDCRVITKYFTGVFLENHDLQKDFLNTIKI